MLRADFYLAVSETTKLDMIKYLGIHSDLIHVVPHGVDPLFQYLRDRKSLAERLRRNFGIRKPYILYVGAIGRHKNVMAILTAYRRLLNRDQIPHDLVLAGPPDSAWQDAQDFITAHSLQQSIFTLGQLSQDTPELTDLYNGADCFVFPSFYEGWCSPPLEAMACGTPVIASRRSSIPETLGNAALLIDPDEPEALAEQLSLVLNDRNLHADLVEKGFRRAGELSWSASALRLIDIYKKIEGQL